ncbi:hypothetical protein [Williamsia muralis]|uniref:hypothetical protein n=1 Tax=Williamsia marianensis TaxID=85044 RepID=UPI00118033C9|nr:hypothetical protein [Williamsia marianensis]
MTDEVKFTDAQWDELARAAEAFATVLQEEQSNLVNVLMTNWAGECAEGEGVIANLRELIRGGGNSSLAQVLDSESSYLRSLASNCIKSKTSMNVADMESAVGFRQ